MNDTTEWATIGKIVAPFGIRGEVKLFSLSDVPDRFSTLRALYLGPSHTRFVINAVRPYKASMVVVKFAGVNDANSAETLRNSDVFIPASELAVLPPDSYYQHDILGLHVRLLSEQEIGVVTDILPAGTQDVYVIKNEAGHQYMVPAVKEFIKQIDLIRQVMYIDPIKGLIDDDAVIDDPDS